MVVLLLLLCCTQVKTTHQVFFHLKYFIYCHLNAEEDEGAGARRAMLEDIMDASDVDRDGLISEDEFFRRKPRAAPEVERLLYYTAYYLIRRCKLVNSYFIVRSMLRCAIARSRWR